MAKIDLQKSVSTLLQNSQTRTNKFPVLSHEPELFMQELNAPSHSTVSRYEN